MDFITDNYSPPTSKISEFPCEECTESVGKYRCPRCNRVTCSLPCCQAHKQRHGCSGRRDRAAYIKRTDYDLPQLSSDIALLEDVARVTSGAYKRMRSVDPMAHKEVLVLEANRRGVDLRLLAEWFPKRKENQTYYHGKKMFWTVRWLVELDQNGTQIEILKHRSADFNPLVDLLKSLPNAKSLSEEQRSQLVSLLNDPALQPRFVLQLDPAYTRPQHLSCPLDGQRRLRQCLGGKIIVEYPTFHVSFAPKQPPENTAITEAN
ncbi:box C/D snoRNA protein 1-like [Paramacrobiotus metropolitanus]|uniref:box C/D snoRNA protein 1-like n=1 Tax=Paramacrobiotus metropolitanus TaxID=2943436 RepID=UPI002445E5F8|nr:box C/D snoRNA protein 1-like [Paramacrobiotus metropolitanus]